MTVDRIPAPATPINQVVVIIGAGGIGVAIGRRQGFGKTLLLADFNEAVLAAAAADLRNASYVVETQIVDVSFRESVLALVRKAASLGGIVQAVNTAGLSPNMAPPERVLAVDLYGSALVFEAFGAVIASGCAGLIISSMAGHMLPPLTPEQNQALAFTPADELLDLSVVKAVPNSMVGYIIAKRANHLRVQAEAVRWGERGARVNSISPDIIATPLAQHELNSPIGDGYRAMIAASPARRMAPPEDRRRCRQFAWAGCRLHHRQRPPHRRRRHRSDVRGQAADAGLSNPIKLLRPREPPI